MTAILFLIQALICFKRDFALRAAWDNMEFPIAVLITKVSYAAMKYD
jgi:hypothetical protein